MSQEEREHFEKLVLELEEEEKKIAYMIAGGGRGPTKYAITLAAS